jgi:ATP-dependent protease ClpP protease subunit
MNPKMERQQMSKQLLQLLRDNAQRNSVAIRTEMNGNTPEIFLYDVIDAYFGIGASDFIAELDKYAGQKVVLRINSPGGDVFEARAMATAIAKHGDVHAKIDSLAASAATYVATACKTVEIAQGGFFMIHYAWTFAYGNKDDLTKTSSLLDKVDQSIIADYVRKSGAQSGAIEQWMADETWFTADEAKQNGFVDSIFAPDEKAPPPAARAAWNVSAYSKAPKALTAPPPPAPAQVDEAQLQSQRLANMNRLRLLELT